MIIQKEQFPELLQRLFQAGKSKIKANILFGKEDFSQFNLKSYYKASF